MKKTGTVLILASILIGGFSQAAEAATTTYKASGAIGTLYNAKKSIVGNPTGPEHKLTGGKYQNTGAYQNFQKAKIHWSKATGAHYTTGGIQNKWKSSSWERGYLGYPTTDEKCGMTDNGCYQKFEGGNIYWSRVSGAHVMKKGTLTQKAWASTGYESGRLGYPLTEETSTGTQKFIGGTISIVNGKAQVTYNAAQTIRVASYNISCANCSDKKWSDPARGAAVAADIRKQAPDAIGIQEASQGWITDAKGTLIDKSQFEDLGDKLGSAGYSITNNKRNNCVNDKTPTKCVYKNQGATKGTRIFYNTNKVALVKEGSVRLSSPDVENERYFAWSVLTQRATGKQFFFGTTHLSPNGSASTHTKQAQEIVSTIKKNNPSNLPVVITGDFNSSNFRADGYNPPSDELKKAGYKDFLGHTFGTFKPSSTTPANRINAEYASFNGWNKNISVAKKGELGSTIDYIFGSKNVTVKQWETVVHVKSPGVLSSTPSDHNMIRADIGL